MASVSKLFICATAGEPMKAVDTVSAIANAGLAGDRYAVGKGIFSGKRHDLRHVTLISVDDFADSNARLAVPFTAAETRRNIFVAGEIDLHDLIGKDFYVGLVRMRGVEEATPCQRPSQLAGKPDFITAFQDRGGIRAELLSDGEIKIGDAVGEKLDPQILLPSR